MLSPYQLLADSLEFPNPELALTQPDGLLAVGGDLSPERLISAYRSGIFPWFQEGDPIFWWSPNPRMVIFPEMLRISRSLHKRLMRQDYQVSFDRAFEQVIDCCAAPRRDTSSTWVTTEMRTAYVRLHEMGLAHSVEVWIEDELAGGLYGVCLGRMFFGESMFSNHTDGSKIALTYLAGQLRSWGFPLIDCQVANPHLLSLGGIEMSRRLFLEYLRRYLPESSPSLPWTSDWRYDRQQFNRASLRNAPRDAP